MGIGALVLGLVGLIVVLFPFLPTTLGIILGIIGIVLGALGRKDPKGKGLATAGLVLGIIAVVFGVLWLIACNMAASTISSIF